MPRVNIYVRNEDWEAWQNIEDKPQWLHNRLTPMDFTNPQTSSSDGGTAPSIAVTKQIDEKSTMVVGPAAKYDNPFACKKCGSMLVAGKCLNKH